ncbi:MAG: phosphoenolpyruvate carboxykinase (ATP), partial [Gammaproteobacteria bacterium]
MALDIDNTSKRTVFQNLSPAALTETAILRGEGELAANGSLVVRTGTRTGRSPRDRFIVDEPSTSDLIDWGAINQPISPSVFDALWNRVQLHLAERDTFVATLHVGADAEH